uniref:FHA domain-containing protein n=1 Tax=Macrostomum lignano TaxID=282301 RepID=A0A1I8FE84_9PLAT
ANRRAMSGLTRSSRRHHDEAPHLRLPGPGHVPTPCQRLRDYAHATASFAYSGHWRFAGLPAIRLCALSDRGHRSSRCDGAARPASLPAQVSTWHALKISNCKDRRFVVDLVAANDQQSLLEDADKQLMAALLLTQPLCCPPCRGKPSTSLPATAGAEHLVLAADQHRAARESFEFADLRSTGSRWTSPPSAAAAAAASQRIPAAHLSGLSGGGRQRLRAAGAAGSSCCGTQAWIGVSKRQQAAASSSGDHGWRQRLCRRQLAGLPQPVAEPRHACAFGRRRTLPPANDEASKTAGVAAILTRRPSTGWLWPPLPLAAASVTAAIDTKSGWKRQARIHCGSSGLPSVNRLPFVTAAAQPQQEQPNPPPRNPPPPQLPPPADATRPTRRSCSNSSSAQAPSPISAPSTAARRRSNGGIVRSLYRRRWTTGSESIEAQRVELKAARVRRYWEAAPTAGRAEGAEGGEGGAAGQAGSSDRCQPTQFLVPVQAAAPVAGCGDCGELWSRRHQASEMQKRLIKRQWMKRWLENSKPRAEGQSGGQHEVAAGGQGGRTLTGWHLKKRRVAECQRAHEQTNRKIQTLRAEAAARNGTSAAATCPDFRLGASMGSLANAGSLEHHLQR